MSQSSQEITSLLSLGAALLGASLQELVHWYRLRGRLSAEEYKNVLRSIGYWIITILMIAWGTLGTAIWYYDTVPAPRMREYLIMGMALPMIFKLVIQVALTWQAGATLGPRSSSPARRYFG